MSINAGDVVPAMSQEIRCKKCCIRTPNFGERQSHNNLDITHQYVRNMVDGESQEDFDLYGASASSRLRSNIYPDKMWLVWNSFLCGFDWAIDSTRWIMVWLETKPIPFYPDKAWREGLLLESGNWRLSREKVCFSDTWLRCGYLGGSKVALLAYGHG